MTSVLITAAAVTLLALLARRFLRSFNLAPSTVAWPFYPRKLLTEPEQVLYYRLVKALPGHIVLAQVQLSRVLGVKKGFNFREWNNRINRMSLDFVVCRKDASIVAAIELDDATHDAPKRVEADAKKEKALASAGVRLVRWHTRDLPSEEAIQNAFVGSTVVELRGGRSEPHLANSPKVRKQHQSLQAEAIKRDSAV